MEIRPAIIPDEVEIVRTIFQEYVASVGIDVSFQGFDEELRTLPGKYATPTGNLWLAVDSVTLPQTSNRPFPTVAGAVGLRPLSPTVCEIKRLYVRDEFRGRGVARQLIQQLLTFATASRYRNVCLDTLPIMAPAIALYRSLGFVDIPPYCYNPDPAALYLGRDL